MSSTNRSSNRQTDDQKRNLDSVGNKQKTAQTGGQNAGGENRDQQEDQYTEDLRRSGDRNSSNTKKE